MATVSEIKGRLKSVEDTRKITNAMYLIASMKLQKAKSELDQTRPYFDAVSTEIKRIFKTAEIRERDLRHRSKGDKGTLGGGLTSRYFFPIGTTADSPAATQGTEALLVITADKGLAGAYNQNALKLAEKSLAEHPGTQLYVVGEYGRQYFLKRQIPVEQNFLYTAQNPTMERAREIASVLLEQYDQGKIARIVVLYTDLKNGMNMEPRMVRLLPFRRETFLVGEKEAPEEPFEFFPSLSEVLDALIPSYVSGFIYSSLVDSFCSEQSARMSAMQSASDNATELMDQLKTDYNRVRQSLITQEITEISASSRNKQ